MGRAFFSVSPQHYASLECSFPTTPCLPVCVLAVRTWVHLESQITFYKKFDNLTAGPIKASPLCVFEMCPVAFL